MKFLTKYTQEILCKNKITNYHGDDYLEEKTFIFIEQKKDIIYYLGFDFTKNYHKFPLYFYSKPTCSYKEGFYLVDIRPLRKSTINIYKNLYNHMVKQKNNQIKFIEKIHKESLKNVSKYFEIV